MCIALLLLFIIIILGGGHQCTYVYYMYKAGWSPHGTIPQSITRRVWGDTTRENGSMRVCALPPEHTLTNGGTEKAY